MIVQRTSDGVLTNDEIREATAEALEERDLAGRRVLVIIPDHTRTVPMPVLFRLLCGLLDDARAEKFDFLIALGTHPPMTEEHINRLVGLTPDERRRAFRDVGIFNHLWKDPSELRQIGVITEDEVAAETNGMMRERVPVVLNRMIFDYDHLIIVSPVFPHEVAGFSGGHKYLFPGIAAQEIIDFTHWLGAVVTNPLINGTKDTPVRRIIERAASFVDIERTCLALVTRGYDISGLFVGDVYEAWSAAADFSARHHIHTVEKPFRRVLSCAPEMYDDIWTAGKCMYKLEPALADGAELVIYAPHITEVSYTHGWVLDEIGYHVRDYFLKQWDRFKDYPRGVLAHSTHVKGIGTYENAIETPRVNVSLATGIPEERCRKINLGYVDPGGIDKSDWEGREDEGVVVIPRAGEHLYRLADGTVPRIPGDV
ncbi:MAG TPA: lactate racemase domain-containing protein [Planctomycetota bacterium]|nr:lactate racemase domain-containing protein [Planctomycetota bacterium]